MAIIPIGLALGLYCLAWVAVGYFRPVPAQEDEWEEVEEIEDPCKVIQRSLSSYSKELRGDFIRVNESLTASDADRQAVVTAGDEAASLSIAFDGAKRVAIKRHE